MKILVTGGAGYIGSHTAVVLLEKEHDVVIADNLSNSDRTSIDAIHEITQREVIFEQTDVTDPVGLDRLFSRYAFDGVIHFAGFKAVAESVVRPLDYYFNNVVSTIQLCLACQKYSVNRFVFSSSATVYGDNEIPFREDMELKPRTNPYGETKVVSEDILKDYAKSNPNAIVKILRYFNPIGAHHSGRIGDAQTGIPNNLMPYIVKVAKGELPKLNVYGNDYPTLDGTGVRDYIHVMDLAEGHVAALNRSDSGAEIFNLGTGKGTSVLELLKVFQKTIGVSIPYEICERRSGDIAECYASTKKAENELGWRALKGLEEMVRDAWLFEKLR
jgi:UDP-glucose 4-epimerase